MAIEDDPNEPKVQGPIIRPVVVLKFFFFSALMLATPTASFFLSYYGYFDGIFAATIGIPNDRDRAAVSGLLAVICVNVVVGAFVVMAFKETDVVKDKRRGVKAD